MRAEDFGSGRCHWRHYSESITHSCGFDQRRISSLPAGATVASMSRISFKPFLWIFLRVGNLTFGGGDPTMAALQSELVHTRGWLTAEQYALIYGLARITPGTNLLAFSAASG